MQAQLVVAVAVGCLVVDALAEAKEALGRRYWAQREEAMEILRVWLKSPLAEKSAVDEKKWDPTVMPLLHASFFSIHKIHKIHNSLYAHVLGIGPTSPHDRYAYTGKGWQSSEDASY